VVRLERRPGHARPDPYYLAELEGSVSKLLIGKYQATIYPEGNGYTGAIDLEYNAMGRRKRRTLEVPNEAADALRDHHKRQAARRLRPGAAWLDNDLVFCTRTGTPLAAGNVRRSFRAITEAAGIGEDWTPRDLRHSFVSILSDNGVSIETIADLVGHKTTVVTQKVYRHQLKPVITTGATMMNSILDRQKGAKSA
jgi:integrase